MIARVNLGGTARWLETLTAEQIAAGQEVMVAAGRVQGDEVEDPYAGSMPLTRLDDLGRALNPLGDARALVRLRELIGDFKPDVVNTHTAKAGFLGRTAALSMGRHRPAIVHTVHGHLLTGYFSPLAVRGIAGSERLMAAGSDLVLAAGQRVKDDLVAARVVAPDKVVVVRPGVKDFTKLSKAEAAKELGIANWGGSGGSLEGSRPVAGWLARVVRIKRPDRLVGAALVTPGVDYLVGGDGALRLEMERRAPANMLSLGWVDPATFWSACDLAVLTSDNEALPYSLIEAALAGLPAVTTDAGSAPEVVLEGITGLVVPKSPGAVAEGVRRLAEDPDWAARLGAAARERALVDFSPEQMLASHTSAYDAAISRRGQTPRMIALGGREPTRSATAPQQSSGLRILHIITRINQGGTARWLDVLVEEQRKAGHEVLILTGSVQDGEAEDEVVLGLPIIRIPSLGRRLSPLSDVRALEEIARWIRRLRPDVINTHTSKAGALGRLANFTLGPNRPTLVHTVHGHLLRGFAGPWGTRLIRGTERALGLVSDGIICVGPTTYEGIVTAGIGKGRPVVNILPGARALDLPSRAVARARLGLAEKDFVVAWVGRMTRQKNPERALAAAALLPDTTWIMAGDGDLFADVRAAAPSNVRLLGWTDPAGVLAAADVYVHTSDWEGFPYSVVEALSAGLEVVTTDSVPPVDGVVRVNSHDSDIPQQLAELLAKIRCDRAESLTLSTSCAQEFQPERFALNHDNLYARAVMRRRP